MNVNQVSLSLVLLEHETSALMEMTLPCNPTSKLLCSACGAIHGTRVCPKQQGFYGENDLWVFGDHQRLDLGALVLFRSTHFSILKIAMA